MSTVVFSRLIQPQFSFLFSNYNPSNVKTTMKARIELDNLQLHPQNMSFFASAFGPYRVTNGTIGHLLIRKSLVSADTTPIRIEVTDLVMNVDLLENPVEYDTNAIPGLSHPAENVEAELDTCTMKVNSMKINLNIHNKFTLSIFISKFTLYGTNNQFLIEPPFDLKQAIQQSGFAYNELSFHIEKVCLVAHKPNFDELLGLLVESMPVTGRMTIKKRPINICYNTSELDLFMMKDLALTVNKPFFEGLMECNKILEDAYKMWDFRKHMYQVVNHVPSMLSFVSRMTLNFQGIVCHVEINLNHNLLSGIPENSSTNEFVLDAIFKKGFSLTSIFYPDCLFVSRSITVFPPVDAFVNGELILSSERSAKTMTIPQADPVSRSYLKPKGFFLLVEALVSHSVNNVEVTVPGKVKIDTSNSKMDAIKALFARFLARSGADGIIKGTATCIESVVSTNNYQNSDSEAKNYGLSARMCTFEACRGNGQTMINFKGTRGYIIPSDSTDNSSLGSLKTIEVNTLFPDPPRS
ncbi:hypothetical protein TRFO_42605 [Tritrichomonas foetus]|uniref:Uncharacterized protein n=1 Tax=Tritrichomonas foetus TaxID=1144522 RepID=A0A1J4L095_9EUKA|nr:hypothetical protein TRFO_42605 [Tritrichomonas foetus]|eukprot:OHT15277.1 hypothetical protein TRFO_42605 [Tritrichomonas foetus]